MLNSFSGFANIWNQIVEHVVHVCTHVTIFPGNNFDTFCFCMKKNFYLSVTGTFFERYLISYCHRFSARELFRMEHTNWIQKWTKCEICQDRICFSIRVWISVLIQLAELFKIHISHSPQSILHTPHIEVIIMIIIDGHFLTNGLLSDRSDVECIFWQGCLYV